MDFVMAFTLSPMLGIWAVIYSWIAIVGVFNGINADTAYLGWFIWRMIDVVFFGMPDLM